VQPPPALCFFGIEFPCFATHSGSTLQSVVGHVFHGVENQMEPCKGLPACQSANERASSAAGSKGQEAGASYLQANSGQLQRW
jgi:hypothetical protein